MGLHLDCLLPQIIFFVIHLLEEQSYIIEILKNRSRGKRRGEIFKNARQTLLESGSPGSPFGAINDGAGIFQ